jgi:hypothetical protein
MGLILRSGILAGFPGSGTRRSGGASAALAKGDSLMVGALANGLVRAGASPAKENGFTPPFDPYEGNDSKIPRLVLIIVQWNING